MTRILIVDDHEENIYYLATLLRAHGYELDTARHGAEALVKARQALPDMVVSDLLMPVMDGYTLLRHWKSDARLKQVPFVVYTATYTDPDDERLALSLGADAFILKPAEPDAFLARLKSVAAHGAPATPAVPEPPRGSTPDMYREYSETLIRKLEEKMLQLEETNRSLESDMAARVRAEVALRESEERFRQLAESIDDVFWLSDPDKLSFFYVSPAYETIWGRSCESLYAVPQTWLDSIHPEDRARVRQWLPEQLSGEWDKVYRIVRPDGSVCWIRTRAFPVRDKDARVYRIAGVSRDITEQRRLEEQLRQAQKMEAVGRLAGGVAHDFNNILFVIMSYAHLALDTLSPRDASREAFEEIRRASERATGLTQQLLTFSRQQVLAPRVLDVGHVVRDMESMLRRLGEDIVLSLQPSNEAARVYVDPSQMEQVIMNLAVNARDAMPSGGTLTIETANLQVDEPALLGLPHMQHGAYVVLSVSDTGVGMDAATQERMFEPFFTTKEVGKGTGLGLSTVYGIVKQSGGSVTVHSELGKGTTFHVFLPRTERVNERLSVAAPVTERVQGS
jgi:two-component system, cell cycle sensor histidine kinase and response regulator CckA